MMVLGKGLSGAIYPITATCYKPELDRWLAETNPFIHVSTFGGSDIGCMAALTMLDIVADEAFLKHVREMGERLMGGLRQLQQQASMLIREVRGRGLMIGVELPDARLGPLMTVLLAERGVLALYANNNPAVMIVMPPLVISSDEVDEILGAFAGAFEAMAAQVG